MNLLVTGAWQCTDEQLDEIRKLGHEVVFMQFERDPLPCEYDWVEGVVCNGLFLSHPIEKFSNLKYIQLTSAGFDRVPMEYVNEQGIEIHNARGVYSIPMAEFALCGVLQLYKQSRFFYENQKICEWGKSRNLQELAGKQVLIIGCGSVGNECAKRFSAFDCEVTGIDLLPRQDVNYRGIFGIEQLDKYLAEADVVIFTLPLYPKTWHLINEDRLKKLKSTAVLVNIGRGGLIDTDALISVLPKIGGAVLDVFEEEPLPPDSPLWKFDNVIVTPHNSFVGDNTQSRMHEVIMQNLKVRKQL